MITVSASLSIIQVWNSGLAETRIKAEKPEPKKRLSTKGVI